MFVYRDLSLLIDQTGTWSMENGWQLVIRAEWVDVTAGHPHGVDYALILQDEHEQRLLGFDNSHAYDGAKEDEPFDHEHRANAVGRALPYRFTSAAQLITDFFARCEAYCNHQGVEFKFVEDVS